MVADGVIGGFGARRAMACDGDCDYRLLGFLLLRDRLKRFDIRLLRIGDGIKIHRPDVALGRVGIGLGPQTDQCFRQVFCLGRLAFDNERAAAVALAPRNPCIDRVDKRQRVGSHGRRGEGRAGRRCCQQACGAR